MEKIDIFFLIIKIGLFIAALFLVYFTLLKIRGELNKDIQEAKNLSFSKKSAFGRLLQYLSQKNKKSNWYSKIENYLVKAGRPLNFTPISYIMFKAALTIFIPVYAYLNYKNFLMPFLGLLTGFFVLDIYIYVEKKNRHQRILGDLPDVIDSLKIQVSSGVPLTAAIQELYKIPKDKEFSKLLELLSARYNITKDMSEAVDEFKNHFDMVEIEGLCLTLEQNEKTGSSLRLLENQSQVLQANYFFKIQRETKQKEYIIIFCMILVLINIATVILYPIISQINESLKTIFS